MSKLQMLQGIAQCYMQWFTTRSKPQGSKYNDKAKKHILILKNHLLIPLDLILGKKSIYQT